MMKKILMIAAALLMGFVAEASNLFSWNWPAMPTISSGSLNVRCIPAVEYVHVSFHYDYNVVVGTTRNYRAMVELRKVGGGATFYSPWAPIVPAAAGSYPATYTSYTQNTSVGVSASGVYTGKVWVQYQELVGGSWSGWYTFSDFNSPSSGPEFQFNKSNSDVTFTVNGKTYSGNNAAPPTEIVLCNGEDLKIDGITGLGTHSSIETSIESGWYEASIPDPALRFTPYGGFVSPFLVVGPGLIYLSGTSSLFVSWYFVAPVRYVKVKVKVYGPCDPAPGYTIKEMIFKVTDASAFVDFKLNGTDGNPLALNQSLPIADIGVQTPSGGSAPASSVVPGWMGAFTAGIFGSGIGGGFLGGSGTVTGLSHSIIVHQVNSTTGAIISVPIVNYTSTGSGLPGIKLFNSISTPALYFYHGYNSISPYANGYTYKVVATVVTDQCGPVSNYSYFKIVEGIPGSGAELWRTTDNGIITGQETMQQTIAAYPNPSSNFITFDYGSIKNESNAIRVVMTDLLGRKVISEETLSASNNKATLNIEKLPAGNYFYKVEISDKTYSGRVTKN